MKIAITATGPDLDSIVDPRFGRCAHFLIIDPETLEYESIENPNISLGGGAGIQSVQLMAQKEVDTVLTGNCGPNAFRTFEASGIQVITGVSGSIQEAVNQYNSGAHPNATSPNVTSHFGMRGTMRYSLSPGGGPQAASPGSNAAGGGMGRKMGGGGSGMGRGMGRGRGMSGGMQSDSFQTYSGGRQNDSGGIDALKEQVKIMEERLASLKEQIQDREERGKDSRLIAHVIPERCTDCRFCQDVCPTGAISFIESVARIDGANCTACGRCVEACPQEAIVLRTA